MIHAIRKLARDVRRHSVWHVLGVYAVSSWVVWAVVGWVAAASGLPVWTQTMALVLLVALLPLVVATAVVQGGLPGLQIRDAVDPNELVGLTPDQVLVIPEHHPLHGSSFFTWRNTVLGGVSAAALLATSVIAYMTMWALGIGPVGSLLAQGVIAERDPVVLAAFVNRTDDASLGVFLGDAFELEIERSGIVRLAAQREAPRLVVEAGVARRDGGYVLNSSLSLPSGSVLARFEQVCRGDDDLLLAVERLAERVRERLGESLRVIREGERLAPIVTSSVPAAQLYREAGRASAIGDVSGAIDLLEQSVEVDPAFAMAWRRLGMMAERADDPGRAREAYQRVVDLWADGGAAERTVAEMRERISALPQGRP